LINNLGKRRRSYAPCRWWTFGEFAIAFAAIGMPLERKDRSPLYDEGSSA